MSLSRSVLLVLLAALAASHDTPWHDENRYRCLHCSKSTDLMCYSNQTCGDGKKMCYYHIWQPINPGKSKWDSDYHTDMREWGCTESLETCQSTCASTGCNTAKRACCSADTYQLSHNYTDDNILAYRQCYYGNMAHSPRLPTSLLICCLALFYGG